MYFITKQIVVLLFVSLSVAACGRENKVLDEVGWNQVIAEMIKDCDDLEVQPSAIFSGLESEGFLQDQPNDIGGSEELENKISLILESIENNNYDLSCLNQCLYYKYTNGDLGLEEKYVFYNLLKLNVRVSEGN